MSLSSKLVVGCWLLLIVGVVVLAFLHPLSSENGKDQISQPPSTPSSDELLNYNQAKQVIVKAKNALDTYQNSSSEHNLQTFFDEAKLLQRHVLFLLNGTLDILIKILNCRTRSIKQEVDELVKIINNGVMVDNVYREMTNISDRESFGRFVNAAIGELTKRLDSKLDECRKLMFVTDEMQRIADAHADASQQKVLEQVYEYLSDRYDKHHWLVLVYNSSHRSRPQFDFSFYKVGMQSGQAIAALPVLHVADLSHQARHWIIDRLCPQNRVFMGPEIVEFDIKRLKSCYDTKRIELILGRDMHFATFKVGTALWTHSPNMDIAQWPHDAESCQLGNDELVLLAVAPSYNIPRDTLPSTSMALINRFGYALTASNDWPHLRNVKYTAEAGQRWKFVDNQLQNDLGQCASVFLKLAGKSHQYRLRQFQCTDDVMWQLDNMKLVNLKYGAFGYHSSETPVLSAATEWYFSLDGRTRYQETPSIESSPGRRLVNGVGLVLTVDGPLSTQLILDDDRNLTGQRWRFEGRHLVNDWDNCVVVVGEMPYEAFIAQRACDMLRNSHSSWVYQDEHIRNDRGYCLGAEGYFIVEEACDDKKLGQKWTLDGYEGPSAPKKVQRSASRALVNGFGFALTVKDNHANGWQWLVQANHRQLKGQRWFFDGHRVQNELGFCMKSSRWWVHQDDCADTDAWYHIGKQLLNEKGCLGVDRNVGTDGAWLVVQQCDVNKLGQQWAFADL